MSNNSTSDEIDVYTYNQQIRDCRNTAFDLLIDSVRNKTSQKRADDDVKALIAGVKNNLIKSIVLEKVTDKTVSIRLTINKDTIKHYSELNNDRDLETLVECYPSDLMISLVFKNVKTIKFSGRCPENLCGPFQYLMIRFTFRL